MLFDRYRSALLGECVHAAARHRSPRLGERTARRFRRAASSTTRRLRPLCLEEAVPPGSWPLLSRSRRGDRAQPSASQTGATSARRTTRVASCDGSLPVAVWGRRGHDVLLRWPRLEPGPDRSDLQTGVGPMRTTSSGAGGEPARLGVAQPEVRVHRGSASVAHVSCPIASRTRHRRRPASRVALRQLDSPPRRPPDAPSRSDGAHDDDPAPLLVDPVRRAQTRSSARQASFTERSHLA